MNCIGCGFPIDGNDDRGVNIAGEKVEYHGYQAKCVELLRDSLIITSAELEKERVQHAGCLTAAEGWAGKNPPKKGDYGYSVAFEKTLELRQKYEAALLQNGELKRAIWKHLHIKHERTICPLSVGTSERCCEIIMRDAGLNPANGTPIEKPEGRICLECGDPRPCSKHNETLKPKCEDCKGVLDPMCPTCHGKGFPLGQVLQEIKRHNLTEKRIAPVPICDKEYAATEDTYGYCTRMQGHSGDCGRHTITPKQKCDECGHDDVTLGSCREVVHINSGVDWDRLHCHECCSLPAQWKQLR